MQQSHGLFAIAKLLVIYAGTVPCIDLALQRRAGAPRSECHSDSGSRGSPVHCGGAKHTRSKYTGLQGLRWNVGALLLHVVSLLDVTDLKRRVIAAACHRGDPTRVASTVARQCDSDSLSACFDTLNCLFSYYCSFYLTVV